MAPKILIAEDNDKFAGLLGDLLARAGFAAERAGDGTQALSLIDTALPDLLLLDLKLPGLSGIDLLKKLRASEQTRSLPVVVLTGVFRGEQYARAARSLGVSEYLEKPCGGTDLVAALRRALSAKPAPTPEGGAGMDRHLSRAFLERFSGLLQLKSPRGEHLLAFLQGAPISLRPGFRCADFGDYLRRKGLVSREEYDHYRGPGEYRHELFVQMGCLEYPAMLQEKLSYLAEELAEAFTLPSLPARTKPLPCPPVLQPVTVNVPQVVLRGYHMQPQSPTPGTLAGQFIAPSAGYFRYVNFLAPTFEEKEFLLRMDGTRTVAQCEEGNGPMMPLLKTLRLLGMASFGSTALAPVSSPGFPLRTLFNALEEEAPEVMESLESFDDVVEEAQVELELPTERPAPPKAPPQATDLSAKVRKTFESLKGKDYYQVFGLSQQKFSFDLLKERYFALTREFGPEVLMQLTGNDSNMVQEILSTVTNAYNTLSEVVKKERYDELLNSEKIGLGREGDDRFQAQVQFQSAKVFLEMEEWESAEKALIDACNIVPQNGEYQANLAWAIYSNPKNATSRAAQDKARQMLNRALTMERTADGFAFKGWMLFDAGPDALAEAEFNKSLKINARQMLARKGLRQIQEKREQEKKGIFRRMFR